MLFDLHVHTSISPCSRLHIADVLAHARGLGLDGVCITDHDSMDARFAVREGVQSDGLVVLLGMEYATSQGDFLLFGPFENLDPGLGAESMLHLVREAGGAAVAAHPCRGKRPADAALVGRGLVTCMETFNGRNTEAENLLAREWAAGRALPATAGSDAHTLAELGRAPTRFFTPIRTRAECIAALRKGLCAPALPYPFRSQSLEAGAGAGLTTASAARF